MEAGELGRCVGPAETRQDAPNRFTLSTAAQNHPAGVYFQMNSETLIMFPVQAQMFYLSLKVSDYMVSV